MRKAFVTIILALPLFLQTQAQNKIIGIWEGKIKAAISLRVVFHIQQDSSGLTTIMDSPDQGQKGIRTTGTVFSGDSVYVNIANAAVQYSGKLVNDSTIEGQWKQGMTIPLNLRKVKAPSIVKRPQTPQPPYPYLSEDIVYPNNRDTLYYGATITIPKGRGPFPAILMITGSGQQNRDEEILGHTPFAVIADFLTRNGYVVLRVDDRGMGQSNGDFKKATSKDFEEDARVSLQYLRNRKEVNKLKVGILGHSEGGMIAEMLAAERKDIDFIILLAAPGEKILRLMNAQNAAVAKSSGLGKTYIDRYLQLYDEMVKAILLSKGLEASEMAAGRVLDKWMDTTQRDVVIATTGIKDQASRQNFIKAFTSQLNTPWFRYFLNFDPSPYLQKIHAKVLALNGDKDIQVVASSNLPALKTALKKSPSRGYTIKEMPGLNHLFQHCNTCSLQEYGELEETISPVVLDTIINWLHKNIQ